MALFVVAPRVWCLALPLSQPTIKPAYQSTQSAVRQAPLGVVQPTVGDCWVGVVFLGVTGHYEIPTSEKMVTAVCILTGLLPPPSHPAFQPVRKTNHSMVSAKGCGFSSCFCMETNLDYTRCCLFDLVFMANKATDTCSRGGGVWKFSVRGAIHAPGELIVPTTAELPFTIVLPYTTNPCRGAWVTM